MSSEVDYLRDAIRSDYGAGVMPAGTAPAGAPPPALNVIDRQELTDSDDVRQSRSVDLTSASVVTLNHAEDDTTPIGTEFDHKIETVIGSRIEGVHRTEWGRVGDTTGLDDTSDEADAIPWASLVRAVRMAVLRRRSFPDPVRPDVRYHSLTEQNPVDQSGNYGDYYRRDADYVLDGFEDLPDI